MTTTNINLNDLAHEIYLENLGKYRGITEEQFTKYFVKKMEGVTLTTAMVVHAVVFCTEDYKQAIREINLENNK